MKPHRWTTLFLIAGLAAGACGGAGAADATDLGSSAARSSSTQPAAARPGTLTGRMIIEGGGAPGNIPRPISGIVTFSHDGRTVASVEAGANGRFARSLPPGAYQVRACTPHISTTGPDAKPINACGKPIITTVTADRTTPVQLPFFSVP